MNISLQWLSDFLPGALDAKQLANALMAGGFPVENIQMCDQDRVLDVEITSNRGDCLSHIGIARELGALLDRPTQFAEPTAKTATDRADGRAKVRIDCLDLCPHYTARIITGVKIGPSPQWMQRRLIAVGIRPINNVVDVTNYVMFELGQPLHTFDLDKLAGSEIIVRLARPGEKILSIDGHERSLSHSMLVIADAGKPVALAGVMGGKESEVTDATVNILLESARFDALSVRNTARALTMKSDSSYRFERGIDPLLPVRASLRAAQLILEIAGGQLLDGVLEAGADGYTPKTVSLRMEQIPRLLGISFSADTVINALRRQQLAPENRKSETRNPKQIPNPKSQLSNLKFEISNSESQIQDSVVMCTIPSWRLDLNIEVDLIEEVARTIGYDAIPTRQEIQLRLAAPQANIRAVDAMRAALVAAGYFESVTFSWVSDLLASDFAPPQSSGLARADHAVRKADGQLRPSLLPGLLESVQRNEAAGTSGAKLFEIGSVFWLDQNGDIVETRRVGLIGLEDYRQTRGSVELLLRMLDREKTVEVVPDKITGMAPGAAGTVRWGGEIVGRIGKIDPAVVSKIGLRQTPCAAELDLAPLLASMATDVKLKPLPRFPSVRRDLSLVVPIALPYEKINSLVQSIHPPMMEELEYVTTYRGKPLEKNQKSVTITLIFRSSESTLTAEEVEASVQKVVTAAQQQLGATLRT